MLSCVALITGFAPKCSFDQVQERLDVRDWPVRPVIHVFGHVRQVQPQEHELLQERRKRSLERHGRAVVVLIGQRGVTARDIRLDAAKDEPPECILNEAGAFRPRSLRHALELRELGGGQLEPASAGPAPLQLVDVAIVQRQRRQIGELRRVREPTDGLHVR